MAHMGILPSRIYYIVNENASLSSDHLQRVENEVGGGFSIGMIDSKKIQKQMNEYMSEKRPWVGARLVKKWLSSKVVGEEIGEADEVGFMSGDLTPALLAHAIVLYAIHVPGADLEKIKDSLSMSMLKSDIKHAFDLIDGIQIPFGSTWGDRSKLYLVQKGSGFSHSGPWTFVFHPNIDKVVEAQADVQEAILNFSEAFSQLLRDWKIAKKVRV